MDYDGLIFDLDGTLWNTTDACARGYNRVLADLGLEERISASSVRAAAGLPADEYLKRILQGIESSQGSLTEKLEKAEIYSVRESALSHLYEGVIDGMRSLAKRYKLFVVSNCGESYLEVLLQDTPIGELLADFECYGRTRRSKADNVCAVIKRNFLCRPCYVGDTSGDERSAAEAGVDFYYAQYGFGTASICKAEFTSFTALVEFFEMSRSVSSIVG